MMEAESSVSSSKVSFLWKIHQYKDHTTRIDGPLFTVGKAECYLAVEQYPEAPEWTGVFFCTTSSSIDARFTVCIVDENKKVLITSNPERKTMGKTEASYEWGFPKFIKACLVDEYLRGGTLHLLFDVEIFDGINHKMHFDEESELPPDTSFCDDIAGLLTSYPTDVEFQVENSKVTAHKMILSARSSVFRTMFASGMKEATCGVVKVKDIPCHIFKEMINYIYSSKCDQEMLSTNVQDFLHVAEKYDLPGLKRQCEKVLLLGLDITNLDEILELAETFNLDALRQFIIKYITRNFKSIFPTKAFKDICTKSPHLFAEIHDAVYPDSSGIKSSSNKEKETKSIAAKKKRKTR